MKRERYGLVIGKEILVTVAAENLAEPKGLMRLMSLLIPLMMNPHFRDMASGIGRELGTVKVNRLI